MEENMSHPLLRTLISEMVESYLEESYEDDIIESIFEEVSEETWEAIEEAILNELSPKTLASYVKKATRDSKSISKQMSGPRKRGAENIGTLFSKKQNRETGINRASKRLTK